MTHDGRAKSRDSRTGLFAQNLTFPRNQWYVAAGRSEIGRQLMARKIMGADLVFYRIETGEAVAMVDWCPHRGFKFSGSKLVGDTVECGYHGMRFASSGMCVHIPSQDSIPEKMTVRTFPLVERGHFVWIWMGDRDKADLSLLPAELEFEDPTYISYYVGTLQIEASAAVCFENVIDITHASLLHPGIIDSEDWELMSTPMEMQLVSPTVIETIKKFGKTTVSNYLAKSMGLEDGAVVERTRIAREFIPNLHSSIDTYFDPDEPSRILARKIRYAAFTPRDERSCYLIGARSGTVDDTENQKRIGLATLQQDIVALEATQKYFEEGGDDFKELSVLADKPALMARRIIARLASDERQTG